MGQGCSQLIHRRVTHDLKYGLWIQTLKLRDDEPIVLSLCYRQQWLYLPWLLDCWHCDNNKKYVCGRAAQGAKASAAIEAGAALTLAP
jgi:hypothetical protein